MAGVRTTDLSPGAINRENVKQLQIAWAFDSGESGGLQTSPIIVGDVLYAYTPSQKVFALDAATGKLLWKFDPGVKGVAARPRPSLLDDGKEKRILAGVMNSVYALDADTGKPIPRFGENGRIDLRKDLGGIRRPIRRLTSSGSGLQGSADRRRPRAGRPARAPGDIRAYDVRTGKLRWSFHTIPHPGEFGYETWPKDAWTYTARPTTGRAWRSMTKRGIVYVPTGSAASDFYGANRRATISSPTACSR